MSMIHAQARFGSALKDCKLDKIWGAVKGCLVALVVLHDGQYSYESGFWKNNIRTRVGLEKRIHTRVGLEVSGF